jgi:malonate-semialdehyde dehydrogenase (acetylating)/methylmalonate-semialdehyde dehydrogenase
MEALRHWVNGSWVEAPEAGKVWSPVDGSLLASYPEVNKSILEASVEGARKAQIDWERTPIKERVQVFFRYKMLLEDRFEELSDLVHRENGKTLDESRAEVAKSIELTEFACSMPQLIQGRALEVSKGVECRAERKALGVVCSVAPFNFPHMVPHWTLPNALVLGNAMILKPSPLVPISSIRIAEMLGEAGLPKGLLQVLHGGKELVENICEQPGIAAISFVGSTPVAKSVYRQATHHHKRCLALGGAKNHLVVLEDAVEDMTASDVVASMSGCAGQRCMAASVMLGVGQVDHIVDEIKKYAEEKVPGENLGAVISAEAKDRIENYISQAEKEGAKIILDGRNAQVESMPDGYYVGPTIIDHVDPKMSVAREEIFGPVLSIIRVKDLPEAVQIESESPFGNAASIYTQNGGLARDFANTASAGMIGVNIGVPVPREPFGFGGWNDSKFGACDITGESSIEFWTQQKKITAKWYARDKTNWMS